MKRKFTLLSFLLGAALAQAQPEFNSISRGTGLMISTMTKEDYSVSPGNAGPNQIWDFSDITFTEDSEVTSFYKPSETPYASKFPDATIAETSGDGEYTYSKSTSTELTILGNYGETEEGTSSMIFTDPLIVLKLPFVYNQTITDDFVTEVELSGIKGQYAGDYSATYDGYGTLITQDGTFNDVIRLKTITNSVTTTMGFEVSNVETSYLFFTIIYGEPIFVISEIASTILGETEVSSSVAISQLIHIDANKKAHLQDLKLSLWPNPSSDVVAIDFKDLASDDYTLKVTSQDGTALIEKKLFVTKGESHNIDISELKSGLYFLEVSSLNGIAVKKIVKL